MIDKTIPLIQIENPATLSILIDSGREGSQHKGVCQAGPMDSFAFQMCNKVLGLENNVAIEVCGDGFKFKALTNVTICIAGGAGKCWVNDNSIPMWRPIQLKPEDTVRICSHKGGYRYYVGFSAKLNTAKVFGSYSTVMRERCGGLKGDGKPLMVADQVTGVILDSTIKDLSIEQSTHLDRLITCVYQQRNLGLIRGGQSKQFEALAWYRVLSNAYQIDSNSNRMGIRLTGQSLTNQSVSMRSEGLTMGAVQIPPDGQPIVLMADRQTLGGYPKIGNVAMFDLPYLAQQAPGSKISFTEIDLNTARNQWRLHANKIQQLRTK